MPKTFNWRDHLKVHPAADLFPLLPEDELKALAEDIQKNGLQSPIVITDQNCQLLDGRNRLDALALLGVLEPMPNSDLPGVRLKGGKHLKLCTHGGDPFDAVLSLNLHRRHLTPEQKREIIAKVLKAKPQTSDRQIGEMLKTDHKTVASVRRKKEATGEISPVRKRTGADGKARKQPTTKPTYVPTPAQKAELEAMSKHQDDIDRLHDLILDKARPQQIAEAIINVMGMAKATQVATALVALVSKAKAANGHAKQAEEHVS
jgi:hypothetical protein